MTTIYKRKAYLYDPNISKPARTLRYHKQKANEQLTVNLASADMTPLSKLPRVDMDTDNGHHSDTEDNIHHYNDEFDPPTGDDSTYESQPSDDESEEDEDQLTVALVNQIKSSEYNSDDLMAALLTLFYDARISQSSFNRILSLLQLLLPAEKKCPTSFNQLSNRIMRINDDDVQFEKQWHCSSCLSTFQKLSSSFQRHCNTISPLNELCGTRLDMYYYFNIASQVRRITKSVKLLDFRVYKRSANSNELNDFKDGNLYRRLIESSLGPKFESKQAFTFTINTDGISTFQHSKLTMWPVFLTINEIPIEKRFCIENVIVAGLSVGESKPEVNKFFLPIIKALKELEYGIENDVSYHLVAGVFDKPAKAGVLNMVQYNGFGGCTKCLQPGESLTTKNNNGMKFLLLI
jgi:hypothetical protein